MRRFAPLVLGVMAAVVAGCGQSNPELIPSANAETLQATVDRIQAACEAEDRTEARKQVRLAQREIDALPRAVDAGLKENLQAWIGRIEDRIVLDCKGEATPTPTESATEAPTTAAPTETPTETATEEPTEAPTEAPTETAAPTEAPTEPPADPTTTPAADTGDPEDTDG